MRRMAKSAKPGGQIGPRIVRAWFDSVINPLLDGLEKEAELLRRGNWTWRFRPAALELIRPVRVFVGAGARQNLDHFVALNPDSKEMLRSHDDGIPRLLEKCKELHRAIVVNEVFRELFYKNTSEAALSKLGVGDVKDLFGAYSTEDHLEVLAEHVVNKRGELPSLYTTAPLWNNHREEFLAILERPGVGQYTKATIAAGRTLLRHVERLIRLLTDRRMKLSLAFDEPPVATAPLVGLLQSRD